MGDAYPLHEAWMACDKDDDNAVKRDDRWMRRICAGSLVLPETVGRSPDGTALFCLTCCSLVPPDPGQREQAERAAAAEGARAVEHGPPQPGTLSPQARAMLARGRLPVDERNLGPGERAAISECIALGLADGHGTLTAAGDEVRARVQRPVVPIDKLRGGTDTARYAAAEKKRQRKPKAKKPAPPAAPMVCVCGHGPREHLQASRDVPCVECRKAGATCSRYRQAKPQKAEPAETAGAR